MPPKTAATGKKPTHGETSAGGFTMVEAHTQVHRHLEFAIEHVAHTAEVTRAMERVPREWAVQLAMDAAQSACNLAFVRYENQPTTREALAWANWLPEKQPHRVTCDTWGRGLLKSRNAQVIEMRAGGAVHRPSTAPPTLTGRITTARSRPSTASTTTSTGARKASTAAAPVQKQRPATAQPSSSSMRADKKKVRRPATAPRKLPTPPGIKPGNSLLGGRDAEMLHGDISRSRPGTAVGSQSNTPRPILPTRSSSARSFAVHKPGVSAIHAAAATGTAPPPIRPRPQSAMPLVRPPKPPTAAAATATTSTEGKGDVLPALPSSRAGDSARTFALSLGKPSSATAGSGGRKWGTRRATSILGMLKSARESGDGLRADMALPESISER